MKHLCVLLTISSSSIALAAAARTDDPKDNPGALEVYEHVPEALPEGAPLVVALHACEQFAWDYDAETGWVAAADALGFALLLPQQRFANNPFLCFNWFQPEDASRASGETASIVAMVHEALLRHRLDANRVYVTGLSAGAAMAQVLLVTHPELFAGGALVAGVPFGCARDAPTAFKCLDDPGPRNASEWGALARAAAPDVAGPWPRVSIWQGSDDRVVAPANAEALALQWQDLHRIADAPLDDVLDGAQRSSWANGVLERILIEGMSHGTPVDLGTGCGEPDTFTRDVGICASRRIAEFWSLNRPASKPPRILLPPEPAEDTEPQPQGCAAGLTLLFPLARRRRRLSVA